MDWLRKKMNNKRKKLIKIRKQLRVVYNDIPSLVLQIIIKVP